MLAGNLHAFMIAPNLERTDFHIIASLPDTVDDRNQFNNRNWFRNWNHNERYETFPHLLCLFFCLYFNLRELLIKVWFMALSSIPLEGNWALESAFGGSLRITQLISVSHHTWGITFGMPCHLVQYKLLAWPHVIPVVWALVCHAMLYNHHPGLCYAMLGLIMGTGQYNTHSHSVIPWV